MSGAGQPGRPDWDRIEPLLEACLALSAEERARYLEQECGAETAGWVLRLLAAEADRTSFLRPLDGAPVVSANTQVGPWRLVEKIGEGGMGVVWLGERADGAFQKRIAVKLLKLGLRLPTLERRFQTEVQVLATLEHPSIARFLDGGRTDSGLPYLVLEHVDGLPVDRWCDERRLSLRERAELFLSVCDAVQHAHERGVLHRDLKPGNVLVGEDGVPRLLDFGIAKVVGEMEGLDDLELTATGQRLYSPRYASPEQVRGEETSATSDTYSLGVMLYELLTGRPPYSLTKISRFELERAALEADARRPSLAVAEPAPEEDAAGPAWSLRGLADRGSHRSLLRGDLDWILMTALRKDPERRYATTRDMADDLRRWLEHRPVRARPDSSLYRIRRFARRNRVLVGATIAVLAALTIGLVLALKATAEANRASNENLRTAYRSALAAAAVGLRDGDVTLARSVLEVQPTELRGWEWRHLSSRTDQSRAALVEARSFVEGSGVAVSSDGSWAVVHDMEILWVDLVSGRILDRSPRPTRSASNGIAIRPDDGEVALAYAGGEIAFVAPSTRQVTSVERVGERSIFDVAWSPGGELFAWSEYGGTIVLSDGTTREELARWRAHDRGELSLAFSPDGTRLATSSWDETAKIWSVPAAELIATLNAHELRVTDAAWSSDSLTLVTTSDDATVAVWEAETGRRLGHHRHHRGAVNGAVVLPGDDEVITVGFGGEVIRWELATGVIRARFLGHGEDVGSVASTPADIVTVGHDGMRLWDPDTQDVSVGEACQFSAQLLVTPDGEHVLCAGADGLLRRFTLDGREVDRRELPFPNGAAVGRRFVLAHLHDDLFLLNLEPEGHVVRHFDEGWTVGAPTPSSGDDLPFSLLASSVHDCLIALGTRSRLLDPRARTEVPLDFPRLDLAPGLTAAPVGCLSPDEEQLATATSDAVRVWRLPDGALERTYPLSGELSWVEAVDFAPDGARIFVARTNDLVVLDVGDGTQTILAGSGQPRSLAFHPREPRLALGDQNGRVTIFDAERLESIVTLGRHTGEVRRLVFGPRGEVLVSVGVEGTVRFWTTD